MAAERVRAPDNLNCNGYGRHQQDNYEAQRMLEVLSIRQQVDQRNEAQHHRNDLREGAVSAEPCTEHYSPSQTVSIISAPALLSHNTQLPRVSIHANARQAKVIQKALEILPGYVPSSSQTSQEAMLRMTDTARMHKKISSRVEWSLQKEKRSPRAQ